MARNYPLTPAASRRPVAFIRPLRPLLLTAAGVAGLAALSASGVRGQDLFAAQPLEDTRFAVLGRPIGSEDWGLLVLEQVAAAPRCWTARPDGLVDPSLNRFNFTGICSRYIDSNGYSLRIGEQDLASSYRLRLVQVGEELRLQASSVSHPTDLLVGRGRVPLRDRDGFVQLTLEPGWSLQRRTYQGRSLSHVYFANGETLPALLARLQPPPEPVATAGAGRGSTLLSRLGSVGANRDARGASFGDVADRGAVAIPGRPVPLQVIPFRD
ncbi:DUF3747 domain-containing protein [Synechococcus sp. CBW1004]|jgi:hypothetical protein|uniref:DUF3747 domain-containing protein n=1 Tax=Synechococcus sp. CBW1004 TaxID=1353136 RepID=UPI0018CE4366|nr:DUF3747 domain-containing protein [Synechococcus sp. CBW1004]QPN62326.1 DUF3747 domain-containing protein [Synechococcus sp. CBW1004]